jgi:hypothetical protein
MQCAISRAEMPMLDLDAADVETVARPAARSPDTKAAIRYLEASGAVAIFVTNRADFVPIRVGKIDPRAHVVFWIKKEAAIGVARSGDLPKVPFSAAACLSATNLAI